MGSNHTTTKRLFSNRLGGQITSPLVRGDLGLRTTNYFETGLSNSSQGNPARFLTFLICYALQLPSCYSLVGFFFLFSVQLVALFPDTFCKTVISYLKTALTS